jgi:hypothetical protein
VTLEFDLPAHARPSEACRTSQTVVPAFAEPGGGTEGEAESRAAYPCGLSGHHRMAARRRHQRLWHALRAQRDDGRTQHRRPAGIKHAAAQTTRPRGPIALVATDPMSYWRARTYAVLGPNDGACDRGVSRPGRGRGVADGSGEGDRDRRGVMKGIAAVFRRAKSPVAATSLSCTQSSDRAHRSRRNVPYCVSRRAVPVSPPRFSSTAA